LGLGLELVWVSLAVLKESLGLNWASSELEAIGLEMNLGFDNWAWSFWALGPILFFFFFFLSFFLFWPKPIFLSFLGQAQVDFSTHPSFSLQQTRKLSF
jgi:hypothetical protein